MNFAAAGRYYSFFRVSLWARIPTIPDPKSTNVPGSGVCGRFGFKENSGR
jgi:hypothetical protein